MIVMIRPRDKLKTRHNHRPEQLQVHSSSATSSSDLETKKPIPQKLCSRICRNIAILA